VVARDEYRRREGKEEGAADAVIPSLPNLRLFLLLLRWLAAPNH
jgi:hypothetical protein